MRWSARCGHKEDTGEKQFVILSDFREMERKPQRGSIKGSLN
jgi:hypothetical protein